METWRVYAECIVNLRLRECGEFIDLLNNKSVLLLTRHTVYV